MHMLAVVALSLGVADLATAGVERRFVIYSDPPGALVYRNGIPIGQTPVDDHFVYYGKYHFTLVRDKCKTLEVEQCIEPPWFQVIGVDFFTENLVPYKFRDVRYLYYRLEPLQPINQQEFVTRALEIRARGKSIGAAPVPPPLPPPAPPPGQMGAVSPRNAVNPATPMPFPPSPGQPVAPLPQGPASTRPPVGGGLAQAPGSSVYPPNLVPLAPPTTGSTFIPSGPAPVSGGNSPGVSRTPLNPPVQAPAPVGPPQ